MSVTDCKGEMPPDDTLTFSVYEWADDVIKANRQRAENLNMLFHRLWGKAQDGPNYNKAEWIELEKYLLPQMTFGDPNPTVKLEIQ